MIPTRAHAVIDYLLAAVLIVAPWLFPLAEHGAETWVPVILGIVVALYSLFTAYELGMVPAIGMTTHLGLDIAGGLFLAASPWLFQFADVIWIPHVVLGLLEIGTAMMTQRTPRHVPGPTGGARPTGTR